MRKIYTKIISAAAALTLVAAAVSSCGSGVSINDDAPFFELTADDIIEDAQLNSSVKAIENRAKALGGNYKIETDENIIKLRLGKDVWQDAGKGTYIMNLLTAQGDLYIMSGATNNIGFGHEDMDKISIEKDSVYNVYSGFKDQLDKKSSYNEFENYFEAADDDLEIQYIKISLTDNAAEELKGLSDREEAMCAVFDLEMGEHTGSYTTFGRALALPEGEGFAILNPYMDDPAVEKLIEHIITNEYLPAHFSWQLKDKAEYESGEKVTGAFQKEKIEGNALELKYNNVSTSVSDEDTDKFLTLIKTRLDALKCDYAIGYQGLGGNTIVVRILPKSFGRDFILMLSNSANLQLSSPHKDLYDTVKRIEMYTDGQTGLAATCRLSGMEPSLGTTPADEKIYLKVNDVTVASADNPMPSAEEKEALIVFDNLSFINKDVLGEEDSDVLNFIVQCSDEQYSKGTFSLAEAVYCDDDGNKIEADIPWGYDCDTEIDKKTISMIESVYPKAKASISSTSANSLNIALDIEINENLPKEFTSAVKEIYTQCGLGDGTYRNIRFYIKDETKNSPIDRFRMGYNKMSGSDDVDMRGFYVINGPTFSSYEEEFENIIKTDPLFSSQKWTG